MKKLHPPRLIEQADAETQFGGSRELTDLREAWGLKPAHRAKGFHFFDLAEIAAAQRRKSAVLAR